MNDNRLTAEERQELIAWFAGHPICRLWTTAEPRGLVVSGYIGNAAAKAAELQLRLAGEVLHDVAWADIAGLADEADPDPSGVRIFPWWPHADFCGFHVLLTFEHLRAAGFLSHSLTVEVTRPDGERVCSAEQALHLPMADLLDRFSGVQPPPHLMTRVMGNPAVSEWFLTGFSNLRVCEALVRSNFGRSLADMGPLLEWGSGCGRLSRHLIAGGLPMTGIDIDAEAVAWCNATLVPAGHAEANFLHCDLLPPTPLPDAAFGSAIGLSVITHLDEAVGQAWLAELARLLRPGAALLLTVHGLDHYSVTGDPRILRAMRRDGIFSMRSGLLDDFLGEQEYYRETWHSWDHIRANWSHWFDVLDICRGGHLGIQDVVVMRRNGPGVGT